MATTAIASRDTRAAVAMLAARHGAGAMALAMAASAIGFGVLAAFAHLQGVPAPALAGEAGLGQAAARAASDRALQLAVVASLVLPVLALQALTTPVHAAARRWLGQDAVAQVRTAIAETARWLACLLLAPAAMVAVAWWTEDPADVCLRAGLLMAVAQLGVWTAAQVALLLALGWIARGTRHSWQALSGGGTFGPAEAAPLLYAPAAGLVVGLVPAFVLAAVWGARDSALSVAAAVAAVVLLLIAAPWTVGRVLAQVKPHLHHGLLAVEAAHATPFAEGRLLPPLQPWLRPASRPPAAAWMALAWSRHHPASPWLTAGLVGLAWWAHGDSLPATAWLAATIACHATARAATAAEGAAAAAAMWLGASPAAQRRALAKLASVLGAWGWLALLLAVPSSSVRVWAFTALAIAAGGVGGRVLATAGPEQLRPWLARAALAGWALGLGWAVSSR